MKIQCYPLGPVQANCYVLSEKDRAIVIDPGDDFDQIGQILKRDGAKLEAILLTHAHFDHMAGAQKLALQYDCNVYMNPAEFDFLKDARLNSSAPFGMYVTSQVRPLPVHEGCQTIGGFDVEALFLPGHSIGSTVYIIEGAMFSGDVLFQGSIGRTDLATGDWKAMQASLQVLKTLPDSMPVYPGHGPETTIGQEKRWNPYMR